MRKPEFIRIDNQIVTYLDFSELKKKEEVLDQIKIYADYIKKQHYNSLITVTNLEGMYFNTEVYNVFTEYVKQNNPHVKQSAVIGLKGLMQIFYKGFVKITGRNVLVCNTKNEALNELTSQVALSY